MLVYDTVGECDFFLFSTQVTPLGRVMTSLQSWAGRNLTSGLKIGLSRDGQNVEIPFYIRALEMQLPDKKLEDCKHFSLQIHCSSYQNLALLTSF